MVSNSNGNTNGQLIEELWNLTPEMKTKPFQLITDSFNGSTLKVDGRIKKTHENELLLEIIADEKIKTPRSYMFNVPIKEYFSNHNGNSHNIELLKKYNLVDSAILSTQQKFLTNIYKSLKEGTIRKFNLNRIPWDDEGQVNLNYEIWKPRKNDHKAILASYYFTPQSNRSLKAFVELDSKPEYMFDRVFDDDFPSETKELLERMNKVVTKHKEYLVKN